MMAEDRRALAQPIRSKGFSAGFVQLDAGQAY